MNVSLLDPLTEFNPQLFRELKGRLKKRPLALAVAASIVAQLLLLLSYYTQLPGARDEYNRYCEWNGNICAILWQDWWNDLYVILYFLLPALLVMGGVYMLISDLAREERRGTLNFIRLSPQSSRSILVGKLLGVPVLLYIATAIASPLYFRSAIGAGISFINVVSFYLLLAAICALFYSAAALYALMGGSQGWLGAGAAIWVLLSLIPLDLYSDYGQGSWFGLPLGEPVWTMRGFAIFCCAVGTYWIWQALYRRFRNPHLTMWSKKQSYAIVACLEIFLLGFLLQYMRPDMPPYLLFDRLAFLGGINFFWFLGLIAALSPHRPILQDWARYAHTARRRSVWQDLIWGEKSPAPVAIAINLGITAVVFIPWILLCPVDNSSKLDAIAAVIVYGILMLVYATLAQLVLLTAAKKRSLWAALSVGGAMFLPFVFLGGVFGMGSPSVSAILFCFLAHAVALCGLSAKLSQQLNRAGESATKALLTGTKLV